MDEIPGIRGVVANRSRPFTVSALDLFRLRMFEQNSRAEATLKAARLTRTEERNAREKRKIIVRGARKKLFPGRGVKLIWGDKIGREATVQSWEDQEQVRVILKSLDAAEETITVPFEFLKAAV